MKSVFLFGDGSYHPMHQLCGIGWAVYDVESEGFTTGTNVFDAPDKNGIIFSELMAIREGLNEVNKSVDGLDQYRLVIVLDNNTVARLLCQEQTLPGLEEDVEEVLEQLPENTEVRAVNRMDNEFTHYLSRASVEQRLLEQRMANGFEERWLNQVDERQASD